jgi:hypothetical protein
MQVRAAIVASVPSFGLVTGGPVGRRYATMVAM